MNIERINEVFDLTSAEIGITVSSVLDDDQKFNFNRNAISIAKPELVAYIADPLFAEFLGEPGDTFIEFADIVGDEEAALKLSLLLRAADLIWYTENEENVRGLIIDPNVQS